MLLKPPLHSGDVDEKDVAGDLYATHVQNQSLRKKAVSLNADLLQSEKGGLEAPPVGLVSEQGSHSYGHEGKGGPIENPDPCEQNVFRFPWTNLIEVSALLVRHHSSLPPEGEQH